ncbi:MAG: MCE family protein [Bdellovibrionales bacterium]|nr:MCE family protein [Bdellovibrionales bacterium]
MNLMNTPEFKVGLLVVVVSGLIGVMSMKVSESPNFVGGNKQVWFEIENAGGLIKKSPVSVAGIRVGMIEDIQLRNGRAVVKMAIRPDVLLTESSKVEIRANGILGDKHVEIIPGSNNDPVLNHEGQILVVEDNASIDRLVSEVSKITNSLSDVVNNIRDATEGDDSKPIGKIVRNIETLTTDLSALVSDKKDEVGELIDRLNNIAGSLDEIINEEGDEGFRSRLESSMAKLDSALGNIDEISGKINRGEGTIGRLVNDEETVEGINTAITGINNFIDSGSKIQTMFDYYSHYLTREEGVRSYIGVRIQPGLDRFYEVAGISTPDGVRTRMTNITTVDGGTPQTVVQETSRQYSLRLTALFGKKFYNFTVKGGMIENRGGLGLEYNFYRNRFRLSVDAFDFNETNLRGYLRYSFFKGLYVVGGQQYIFTSDGNDNASTFFGAGLFLTNDDIKVLLSRINF